jgi:hypothetical protein
MKDGQKKEWLDKKVSGWGFNNQGTAMYINFDLEKDAMSLIENVLWLKMDDIDTFNITKFTIFETKKEHIDFIKANPTL